MRTAMSVFSDKVTGNASKTVSDRWQVKCVTGTDHIKLALLVLVEKCGEGKSDDTAGCQWKVRVEHCPVFPVSHLDATSIETRPVHPQEHRACIANLTCLKLDPDISTLMFYYSVTSLIQGGLTDHGEQIGMVHTALLVLGLMDLLAVQYTSDSQAEVSTKRVHVNRLTHICSLHTSLFISNMCASLLLPPPEVTTL